jgi:cytochrome bd ubiquinol oxidase subunit II
VSLSHVVAAVILVALVVYALLAGADFGGGVWDLAASGPRARRQRTLIANAIGPVWEANHVWMIVAVVLLFTAYPPAFATIMTTLHVPLSLMLIGIVLRGSSFVFRKAAPTHDDEPSRLQLVFAVSSLITPVMLGVVVGTVSTPEIGWHDGVATGGFFRPWLTPFPWAVGFLTLSLFAWLAACYLPLETDDPELRSDFRVRSLYAGLAVFLFGAASLALASSAATHVFGSLTGTAWGRAVIGATGLLLAGAILSAWRRRYSLARLLAAAVTVLVILGWGHAMEPWLIVDSLTVTDAAAPPVTLRIVVWILAGGAVVLLPAYAYLVGTFKGRVLFPPRSP